MRILLTEDSAPLRKPVVKALKASGYAVDATGDGAEGWEMAQNHDYDVIVLDIMLPGRDGRELLKRVRSAGKETPVLFLTAKGAIEDRVAGLRLGADDYQVKSFGIEELIARVEALGRRKYAKRSPKLVVADLELNQAAKPCGAAICAARVGAARQQGRHHRSGRRPSPASRQPRARSCPRGRPSSLRSPLAEGPRAP